jgi:hypothetical protein
MDKHQPGWREDYILLLDNCSTHKTPTVRRVLSSIGVPTLFTAPASYACCPVELVFGAIKSIDFKSFPIDEFVVHGEKSVKRLSNKQELMWKISKYLMTIEPFKVKRIFDRQLRNAADFFDLKKF